MIKVVKDLKDIPISLDDKRTNRKRDNCIKDAKYHQKKAFHQQYKQQDIKDELKKTYNDKCVFCEQKITECIDNSLEDCSSTVEHYRPKSKYYWLAYSWDNLLWCCHRCNQNKKNNFDIDKSLGAFDKITFSKKIHHTSKLYHRIERPKIINPELETVLDNLDFKNGIIASDDERVKYTIKICKLDRLVLNEKRQKVLKTFLNKVEANKKENKSLSKILQDLINDFKNQNNEFRALKYWMLKNYETLI